VRGGWRKTSDQHFLIDEETLQDIVIVADLTHSDHIVEVGPGIGVLTRELTKRVKKVTAIEIDPRFPRLLKQFAAGKAELDIQLANALHTPMPLEPYKVVANIPYHITSPLLTHLLLESPVRPTSLTLLIQREVAENICSKGSDSILTVLVRMFGIPSLIRLVSKEAFLPPPEVDSAVIHIECYAEPKVDNATAEKILKLAKLAFAKRRKMLCNSIGETPHGAEALVAANIADTRRPQTLTIEEWIALEKAISKLKTA
jgi:16S rRNA (adenine1518-N6/adenine1519-N6)-dimethyltransferase